MRARYLALLSATAFADIGYRMNNNTNSPDARPLIAAVEALETVSTDDIMKRSVDMEMMLPYWNLTDDLVEGYEKVRSAGETYLPKFADEATEDYNTRLQLTKFTNVYRDIVEGLAAKPFEEEISFMEGENVSKPPAEIEEFIENVDGAGNNISVFSYLTFFNGINSAIDWIFVDYPIVDRNLVRSRADQKAAGVKPFWSHVLGRNVLEARSKIINGKSVLSYVRIYEPGISVLDCVRIFERDDSGVVNWALYEKVEDQTNIKKEFKLIGSGTLSINVIPLVPFVTGRRDGSSWKIFPAMRDAADLQVKLYQAESGLEHITNLAAYPILAANGLRPEMLPDGKTPKKLRRGPNMVLYGIPDGNGNHGEWSYVEPSATSMTFLQTKIDKTKEDLRELGRQPLTATSGNLTVITTAVAAGKAKSAVGAWALALKDALENALVITCLYEGITGYEPEINVYNEFDSFSEGGEDLQALTTMREKGDISRETLWAEMRRRKVLSPEFNAEAENEKLLNEIPSEPDLEDDDDVSGEPKP